MTMNHYEIISGLRISYWCKNGAGSIVAADKSKATRASIAPIGKSWPELAFDLPGEKSEMEKLLALAGICEAHGDHEARKEIREALGVVNRG